MSDFDLRCIQNFLPEEEFVQFARELSGFKAQWGAVSVDYNLPIWRVDLENFEHITNRLLETLNQHTQQTFTLADPPHMNIQTFGLDAAFHVDSTYGAFGTVTHAVTWYCHDVEWLEVYGGYLLAGYDVTDLKAILPLRNMAVLLDADIPHRALAPFHRAGTLTRMGLTLKLHLES